MTFLEFMRKDAVEYKGFQIHHGSVYTDDTFNECLCLAHCPLEPTEGEKAELLAGAKQWIDEREAA